MDKDGNSERRKLCRRQSGCILKTLAAFGSIGQARQPLRAALDIFEPHNYASDADKHYVRQMGECFHCELAHLAPHNASCMTFAMQHVGKLLKGVINSLLDVDTIGTFPTCNLASLSHFGGHSARAKGNDTLSKVQVHSTTDGHDPDREARRIKRCSGDDFDSVGPTYTVRNVWSFYENVGRVLIELGTTGPSSHAMSPIGQDMVDTCKRLLADNELELLPQVSIERECLKRYVALESLFVAVKREGDHFGAKLNEHGGLPEIICTSIIEHWYCLSGTELEVEEQKRMGCDDPDTKYARATALTIQRAYTELSASLIALLLRENLPWENETMRHFVRNNLVASALKGKLGNIRGLIEGAAANFNLCLRKKSSRGVLNQLPHDLSSSFSRFSGELVAHAAACRHADSSDGFGALLFNSLIAAAVESPRTETSPPLDSLLQVVFHRLILTPEAIGANASSTIGQDAVAYGRLQRAIDDRKLCAKVERQDNVAFVGLREWVIGTFLANRLASHSTTPQWKAIALKAIA